MTNLIQGVVELIRSIFISDFSLWKHMLWVLIWIALTWWGNSMSTHNICWGNSNIYPQHAFTGNWIYQSTRMELLVSVLVRVCGIIMSITVCKHGRPWSNIHTWAVSLSRQETLCFVCLFVLRFYGPVNPMGSCRARSVYLTTRLLGRLSPLRG